MTSYNFMFKKKKKKKERKGKKKHCKLNILIYKEKKHFQCRQKHKIAILPRRQLVILLIYEKKRKLKNNTPWKMHLF